MSETKSNLDNATLPAAGHAGAAVVKFDELIARLEAAVGPDTNLDDEIAVAFGKKKKSTECAHCGTFSMTFVQDYTRSMEAALTLVPNGWGWTLGFDAGRQGGKPRAELAEPITTKYGPGVDVRAQVFEATSPAIALCIAALKARAALAKAGPAR